MKNNLVRNLAIVIASIVFASGLAFAYSSSRATVAPARSQIVLTEVRTPNLTASSTAPAANRVGDEVLRARSTPVLEAASAALGITVDELRRSIAVNEDEDATAIVIDGRAPTAAVSTERANAVAAAYEAEVRARYETNITNVTAELEGLVGADEARLAEIQASIAAIDAELDAQATANTDNAAAKENLLRTLASNSPERTALTTEATTVTAAIERRRARIDELAAELRLFDGGIQFVSLADGPSGPVEPQTRRNIGLAAVMGLMMGLGTVWSFSDVDADRGPER